MVIHRYYILPEVLEGLFQQNRLKDFNHDLEKVCKFIVDNRKFWKIQLFGNIRDFVELADLDIYNAKVILSYFLDTNDLFHKFNAPEKLYGYSYFTIDNLKTPPFTETKSDSNIEIFENSYNTKGVIKILCHEKNDPLTILRVKTNYPFESPLISTIDTTTVDSLKQEILFESYIKHEFGDDHENYMLFKDAYLKFYVTFNWKDWEPRTNPFPAHNSLTILSKIHKPQKNDAYLLKWGLIMSLLNGGKFNKLLTQANEKNPRVNYVFQCCCDNKSNTVFYSVDTESGTLEIYDYKGDHLNKVYGIQTGVKNQLRNYKIEVPKAKWLDVNCM